MHWINPDPDGPSVTLRPGKIIFDTPVLWIDPYEVERVAPVRAAAVAPVLSAVSGDKLRTLLREAADAAAAPHGIRYPRSIHSQEAGKAQVATALQDRDTGTATVVQAQPIYMYAPYTGPVALSWDDRQIVIPLRVQHYRKVLGKHMTIRDLGPLLDIHYVGATVPEGRAPIDWWTENDGARLQAELRKGFHDIFNRLLKYCSQTMKLAFCRAPRMTAGPSIKELHDVLRLRIKISGPVPSNSISAAC